MSGTRGLPPRLALFFACIPLFGWWMTGLFDLDEGFYGAIVAEMNRRGEWITPFYNGSVWFEKPILLYWLAKPCVALFGLDFGPRVPSVICTILLFVVCGFFAKKRYGEKAQSATYFCLGTSIIIIALGRLMMTDAALNLALVTAFLSFYESVVGDKRWKLLTGFSLGLGVLAKGPVAILLFGLVTVIALWRDKELRQGFSEYLVPSVGVMLATIATWYVPCYLEHGDYFVQKFLIEQNLNRFLGGDAAHSAGIKLIWMYIPVIAIGVLPWGWIERKAFTKANIDDSFSRYVATWGLSIFVFFTISSAKLPHYVLPVLPAMALLAAKRMSQQPRINWRPDFMMATCVVMLLLLDPLQRSYYQTSGQQEAHMLVRKHPEVMVLFRLGKQEKKLNTGTTKLQETSMPSLVMYLNKQVMQTDDTQWLLPPTGSSINRTFFTRKTRLDGIRAEFYGNYDIKAIEEGENFGVYQLVRAKPDLVLEREAESLIRKHLDVQVFFELGRQENESTPSKDILHSDSVSALARMVGESAVITDQPSSLRHGTTVAKAGETIWKYPIFFSRKSRRTEWKEPIKVIEETENFGVYQLIAK